MNAKRVRIYTGVSIMAIHSQHVCWLMRQQRSRGGLSGCRCGWFKETSLSEVAHDERHGHQSDADANRSKELVDGIGQDERARPCCHFRPNDGLAEAHFAQHSRHIDPTGYEEVEHSQGHEGNADVKGNSHRSILLEDLL